MPNDFWTNKGDSGQSEVLRKTLVVEWTVDTSRPIKFSNVSRYKEDFFLDFSMCPAYPQIFLLGNAKREGVAWYLGLVVIHHS